MQVWDTAGQDNFKSITKTYYKGADAVMVVYDITNPDSFSVIF
jgi:GTPase SAR1 family protein